MNKLIMAFAAIATLTSVSSSTTLPAQAQNCLAYDCGNYKTPNGGGTAGCDQNLGYLPRVYKPEIAGIDETHRVWITELCSDFGMLANEGNAAYLRTTIAQNDVLVEALSRKDHRPEDVFAVKMMGDDTIHLFVHQFGR